MHNECSTDRGTEKDAGLLRNNDEADQQDSVRAGKVITSLALMPANALLNESAMASTFGVTARTVRRMVARNELPPPIRMAGHSTWIAGAVIAHVTGLAAQAARAAGQTRMRLQLRGRPTL